jgi:hypothetical protein
MLMANYMAEIANMLGVDMNQDFECNDMSYKYRITEDGLTSSGSYGADSLMMILNGTLTIKRKPWKPSYGSVYYCVSSNGAVMEEQWYDDFIDKINYKLGNCYKLMSQAETDRDKWVSFYASDDVLEV